MRFKHFIVSTTVLVATFFVVPSNVFGEKILKQLKYDTTLGDSMAITLPTCLDMSSQFFNEEIDTLAFMGVDTLSAPLNMSFPFFNTPVLPIQGNVVSKFGRRSGRMHTGTDIKSLTSDTIIAILDGVVTRAMYYYGYGNLIALNHGNDFETYYSHLSKMYVHVGDSVKRGQVIGKQGSTGRASCRHLHFETRYKGTPYNPELMFDFNNMAFNPKGFSKFNPTDLAASTKPATSKSKSSSDASIATVEGGKVIHVIKQGDTLYALAKKYKTSVKSICKLNKMSETTILKLGRRLVIKS